MTLTEASYWTRKFAVLGAIVLVLLIIVTVVLISAGNKVTLQQEYEHANFRCTKTPEEMPHLDIHTTNLNSNPDSEIVLSTVKGDIEILPRVVNVYAFIDTPQSLNALNTAKAFAKSIGFDPDTVVRKRNSSVYEWTDRAFKRKLIMGASNLDVHLKTDFKDKEKAMPSEGRLPSDSEAKSIAAAFLNSLPNTDRAYSVENTLSRYVAITADGGFTEALARSDADLIRVDFFRRKAFISIKNPGKQKSDKVVNAYKKMFDIMHDTGSGSIFYTIKEDSTVTDSDGRTLEYYLLETRTLSENPNDPIVSVYVGPTDKRKKDNAFPNVYGADITSWKIEDSSCGTYELIPSIQVVSMLKDYGSLVSLTPKSDPDTIRPPSSLSVDSFLVQNIYLSYLTPKKYTPYLQPIWVATGEAIFSSGDKGSFMYYLPAINYDIISAPVEETAPATTTQKN